MKQLSFDRLEDHEEIARLSFANAYELIVGNMTFDELSQQDEFYLPKDWEDPNVLLQYYEAEEEYERCINIVKSITNKK
jgi:hypothetical protein